MAKPNWTGRDFKRARQSAESLYYYRINERGQPEGKLYQDYRSAVPLSDIRAAEIQLANTPCIWHCVSVSLFEPPGGVPYRTWGFARTLTQLRISKDPLDPLLKIAQTAADEDEDLAHLTRRCFIIAPWSKRHPDLTVLLRKLKDEFQISDEEITSLKGYAKSPCTQQTYTPSK